MSGKSTNGFGYNVPTGWGYNRGNGSPYYASYPSSYYGAVPYTDGMPDLPSASAVNGNVSTSIYITPGRVGRRFSFFVTRGGTFSLG